MGVAGGCPSHRNFDGADDDAVAVLSRTTSISLFPADQRFINQQLVGWRGPDRARRFSSNSSRVVSDTAAGAAHGKARPEMHGKPTSAATASAFHSVRDTGTRCRETNFSSSSRYRSDDGSGFIIGASAVARQSCDAELSLSTPCRSSSSAFRAPAVWLPMVGIPHPDASFQ